MFAQRVIVDRPPMFAAIDAVFKVAGRPILFAWGDRIFNPLNVAIPAELVAHEAVHGQRQGGDVEAWWSRYLVDPTFRLAEELPAHVAEFKSLCEQHAPHWHSQNGMRKTMAAHVARKLAAPLYGSLITFAAAKREIRAAA